MKIEKMYLNIVIKSFTSQPENQMVSPVENAQKQPTVIQPPQDSIIADLLSLDLSVPSAPGQKN